MYSGAVLLLEIPLGIALALSMPAKGWQASITLVLVALSLLIPWNVVGTIWQIYGRADIGLLGAALQGMGIDYNYTGNARDAWLTVLVIAVLLRFMDSFMIYTEPFVLTGGGPGNATTFLSQYLTQKAVGQFDLGPAAAFSLIYFLIILLLCFILYNWMQSVGTQAKESEHG
jgi:glycerol transport system permease protein